MSLQIGVGIRWRLARSLLYWSGVRPRIKHHHLPILQALIIPIAPSTPHTMTPKIQQLMQKRSNVYFTRAPRVASRYRDIDGEDEMDLEQDPYTKVNHLIQDEGLRRQYLKSLKNLDDVQAEQLLTEFKQILDISTFGGTPQLEVIELLFEIWHSVFIGAKRSDKVNAVQVQLLQEKDRFVHFLINNFRYADYKRLIGPLVSGSHKVERTFADFLADSFQFDKNSREQLTYSLDKILEFIHGKYEILKKRKLITIFFRKAYLYSLDQDKYQIIKDYLNFIQRIGDGNFDFNSPEFSIYNQSLQLLSQYDEGNGEKHMKQLQRIAYATLSSRQDFENMVTVLMRLNLLSNPEASWSYWKFKNNNFSKITSLDLRYAMEALINLKRYDEVLALYQKFPQVHSDEQIEVLLRLSEKTKNWKLLQKQFEEMYGRGDLPYVAHYSVVMNALALIGAKIQVEELYQQLLKRGLKPKDSIYAALINSCLFYSDFDGARHHFEDYLFQVKRGVIQEAPSSYLYSLIFKSLLNSSDLKTCLEFLQTSVARQNKFKVLLIDSKTMGNLVDFAATNYSPKYLEQFRIIAEHLGLDSDAFNIKLIKAYTRLTEFKLAEEICYKAHQESDVPFKSAPVFKEQLRNYRFWIKSTTDPKLKYALGRRIWRILDAFYDNKISVKHSTSLYTEIIKYHLNTLRLGSAKGVLALAEERSMVNENHYLPFMKNYSRYKTYEGDMAIIETYRHMVKQNIPMTPKTYVHLMRALVSIDVRNQNNFENSYKLLQSVFELNSIKLGESNENRNNNPVVHDHGVELLLIVATYITANGANDIKNAELLTNFLNFIKQTLDQKLSNEFRFTIYREMGNLYKLQGNFQFAGKFIASGIREIETMCKLYVEEYPYSEDKRSVQIPKPLQLQYRRLLSLQFSFMDLDKESPEAYIELFETAESCNIRLSGDQYCIIISKLFLLHKEPSSLSKILSICEKYLMSGSFVEARWSRNLESLYKLVMWYESQVIEASILEQKYRILNRFYNIRSISSLQKLFQGVTDIKASLNEELTKYYKLWYKEWFWPLDKILVNIPEFFHPERLLPTQNRLDAKLAKKIGYLVSTSCRKDKSQAEKLKQSYPLVMEYLAWNNFNRRRIVRFRKQIDAQEPPTYEETFTARQSRTIMVLKNLEEATTSE